MTFKEKFSTLRFTCSYQHLVGYSIKYRATQRFNLFYKFFYRDFLTIPFSLGNFIYARESVRATVDSFRTFSGGSVFTETSVVDERGGDTHGMELLREMYRNGSPYRAIDKLILTRW